MFGKSSKYVRTNALLQKKLEKKFSIIFFFNKNFVKVSVEWFLQSKNYASLNYRAFPRDS